MASNSSSPAPNWQDSPPYPSAARLSDSLCFPQYTASLKCIFCQAFPFPRCSFCKTCFSRVEANYDDKSRCQNLFDDYKECKKKEREARLERNRHRSFFR